jgi:hypothetical protein
MTSANSRKSAKPRSKPWPKGQSGNPAGRPAEGQSWAGVLRDITDRSAGDVAAMVGGSSTDLGRALLQLPGSVALKYLVVARTIAALMFEPTAGLLRVIIEAEQISEIELRISRLEGIWEHEHDAKN